jgi:hypothetical protein
MTNVTISGLPAAGAITGAELVPIVQSGVTSRATVASLPGTYIDARNYAIFPNDVTHDSSAGGNQAIQDALAQKKPLVWPAGLFRLDAPLLCFSSTQGDAFSMYGQGGVYVATKTQPAPPAAASTTFWANYSNSPAVVVSVGRGIVLADFSIVGQNTAPATASNPASGTGPSP